MSVTYLVRRVGDEALVVTDTNDTSLEDLESFNKRVDTLDIQVVRRLKFVSLPCPLNHTHLIEQQDMRLEHTEYCKADTTTLTTGQSTNLLQTSKTGDTEGTEMRSVLLLGLSRELCLKERHWRYCDIERVDVLFRSAF
jgi:hypothetical protein